MTIMKLSSVLFFVFLGCRNVVSQRAIQVNENKLNEIYSGKPVVVISCIKCGCFMDILTRPTPELISVLKKYEIFADSNCVNKNVLPFTINYISQKKIDSIYEDNYNLLIIDKINGTIRSSLIETEGAARLSKLLSNFLHEKSK